MDSFPKYEKEILIDAIIGKGIDMDSFLKYEKIGMMKFTGNQDIYGWEFKEGVLSQLSSEDLLKIYYGTYLEE